MLPREDAFDSLSAKAAAVSWPREESARIPGELMPEWLMDGVDGNATTITQTSPAMKVRHKISSFFESR